MTEHFDAAVIGGGVIGCFAARHLTRYALSVILIDAAEDVCTGITRANSAVVYPGYDHHPGSSKAALTVRANASFDALCRELDVPFSRCGSLMTAYGPRGRETLQKKQEQGLKNGVPGLKLLDGDEARAREPMLSDAVTAALFAETAGTVNPWQLGIAAYENAVQNGLVHLRNARVTGMTREQGRYRICTEKGEILSSAVINCAGTEAVRVQEMLYPTRVQLRLTGADYLVFDPLAASPRHIIFEETESGKGITAVPCTEGNLLLESPERAFLPDFAVSREGVEAIRNHAARLLPGLDRNAVIRSFGAVRPNPEYADGRSVRDFCVEQPAKDFWSLIGIKTPGLTCSDELGKALARSCAKTLGAPENRSFSPVRKAIVPRNGSDIVCQCQLIGRDAVLEAIARGAVSVDGVKRRLGTGMGRCQGSRCAYEIARLLEKEGLDGSI